MGRFELHPAYILGLFVRIVHGERERERPSSIWLTSLYFSTTTTDFGHA